MKNTFRLITYNFKTLLAFELLYKLLVSIVLTPFSVFLFNSTMKITGYNYLTLENLPSFLMNPLTILLLLLIGIFLYLITIFDITTMIVIFDESYHKYHINLVDSIKISLHKLKNVIRPRNILLIFVVLILIPFLNIGFSTGVISSIKIPEFIMDYIDSNLLLVMLYSAVYVFLVLLVFRWIFVFNYIVLEEKTFRQARKSSINLVYSKKTKCMLRIFSYQLIIYIIYLIMIVLAVAGVYFVCKLIGTHLLIKSFVLTILAIIISIIALITIILSNATTFAIISGSYYRYKEVLGEEIKPINYESIIKPKKKTPFKFKALLFLVIMSVISSLSLGIYLVITGKINLNIEYVRNMEITAHRGASAYYPENTMSAFIGAKELGADWIELDVQQTKDQKIVVSHDTNLKRVTGVDKNIIDMTYDEISKLDAGSFFSEEYKDERIPLLSEVLDYASKNNIRLNIELKPTGQEKDFEKDVIDLINEYHFSERCVVTSQVYDVLKNVKEYDSSIKTVYVMSFAKGDILQLEYADAYSIEASSINKTLVKNVHNSGKEIYAWTVNKETSIIKMIDMNVDNIITDDIELGKELLYYSNSSDFINVLIGFLRG